MADCFAPTTQVQLRELLGEFSRIVTTRVVRAHAVSELFKLVIITFEKMGRRRDEAIDAAGEWMEQFSSEAETEMSTLDILRVLRTEQVGLAVFGMKRTDAAQLLEAICVLVDGEQN